jgi:hypothetical protein
LGEHIEHTLEHVHRDADAVVGDTHDHLRADFPNSEHDATAIAGVLGSVAEQIRDDLGQPYPITLHRQRVAGHVDRQFMLTCHQERPGGLERLRDDLVKIEQRQVQPNLAQGHARDVEQLVHQPGQLGRLAVDDIAGPDDVLVGRLTHAHDLDRHPDRRQGIAQFVRQHIGQGNPGFGGRDESPHMCPGAEDSCWYHLAQIYVG